MKTKKCHIGRFPEQPLSFNKTDLSERLSLYSRAMSDSEAQLQDDELWAKPELRLAASPFIAFLSDRTSTYPIWSALVARSPLIDAHRQIDTSEEVMSVHGSS